MIRSPAPDQPPDPESGLERGSGSHGVYGAFAPPAGYGKIRDQTPVSHLSGKGRTYCKLRMIRSPVPCLIPDQGADPERGSGSHGVYGAFAPPAGFRISRLIRSCPVCRGKGGGT